MTTGSGAAPARVHPTADIEPGVVIGAGTAVWAHVHARSGVLLGAGCIVGEHTYLGPGVVVGDLVKINARVYIPTGVTIGRGVMVGAHTVFTNDRHPRAADPDLQALRPSEAGAHTLATEVHDGATIGAGCVIGPGLVIGRFAMVGMGSVVTRDVGDFALVLGSPAREVGIVCRCGHPVAHDTPAALEDRASGAVALRCADCGRGYRVAGGVVRDDAPVA